MPSDDFYILLPVKYKNTKGEERKLFPLRVLRLHCMLRETYTYTFTLLHMYIAFTRQEVKVIETLQRQVSEKNVGTV